MKRFDGARREGQTALAVILGKHFRFVFISVF